MSTALRTADEQFYDEHGWLVVRGAVDAATLGRIRATFDAVMGHYVGDGAAPNLPDGSALWQLPGLARQVGGLLDHLTECGLAELVCGLLDDDSVRLLQDTLILKPAGVGGRIELHQDYTYTGFLEPPKTLSVRLALEPETVEGGCMWVIDGSHHWGLVGDFHTFTSALREVDGALDADRAAQIEARRVPLPLEPGDVSIHHCLTLHGSDANRTAQARKTVVTHLLAGGCRLVRERVPEAAAAYFQTDDAGRLTGDGFPVLFRRQSGDVGGVNIG